MLNIVLFSPAGFGKKPQVENIKAKHNLVHLRVGDIFRAEIAAQTKLGNEAKALIDKGELVPESVIMSMIENKLDSNKMVAGFVFDGIPHTIQQAEALDELLSNRKTHISMALSVVVSEQELLKRVMNQVKTYDWDENTVKSHLARYRIKIEPLESYYQAQGKLRFVS